MVPESSVQVFDWQAVVANTHEISRPLTGNNTDNNACASRTTTFSMVAAYLQQKQELKYRRTVIGTPSGLKR